jgi:hypothetical protein
MQVHFKDVQHRHDMSVDTQHGHAAWTHAQWRIRMSMQHGQSVTM